MLSGLQDLLICDFFLWGYLNSKVYVNHHRTITGLKQNIREEISAILVEMLSE
jgi:hypothetical protein